MMQKLRLFFLPLITLLSACGGGSSDDPSSSGWGSCPSYIGDNPECTFVDVPLDYAKAEGETISLLAFRVRGSAPQNRGQIWFLQGGPGQSANMFGTLMAWLAERHPEWDYYSLDHRGVANSTELVCDGVPAGEGVTPANVQECLHSLEKRWGTSLSQFSTTNAARDVDGLIERFREPGKQVFVYGFSYGTYWLQRYLQIFPGKVDGAILDSICTAGLCRIDYYDRNMNEAGQQVMQACAADAVCNERLSAIAPNPWKAMEVVFSELDAGTLCAPLRNAFDRSALRQELASMVEGPFTRALIPPLIYRLHRCNASDQAVINKLSGRSAGDATQSKSRFVESSHLSSRVLGDHIVFSELWNGIPAREAQGIAAASFVSPDLSAGLAELADAASWPAYSDEYRDGHPDTELPVLMLNSTIDGQTPLSMAQGLTRFLNRPHQNFVALPDAAHGTVFLSAMAGAASIKDEACGEKIMFSFIDDPQGKPDTSCIGGMLRLRFDGQNHFVREAALKHFGSENLWD